MPGELHCNQRVPGASPGRVGLLHGSSNEQSICRVSLILVVAHKSVFRGECGWNYMPWEHEVPGSSPGDSRTSTGS